MKDALGHGSNAKGVHAQGVESVGQRWRLNSHTHEIVSPTGEVQARLRIGKSNGVAIDRPGVGKIERSGGPSLHDAFAMADYRATSGSFPADHITTPLHYLTGSDFAGSTVRRVKKG